LETTWRHSRALESSPNRFKAFTAGFSCPSYAFPHARALETEQSSLLASVLLVGAFFLFVLFALVMVTG